MKTENPSAFPITESDYTRYSNQLPEWAGMTLRDYFAAKAMQSMLGDIGWKTREGMTYAQDISDNAFQIADAMLKRRNI